VGKAFGILLWFVVLSVSAADINAPLSQAPTIGSEIRRGFQAIDTCGSPQRELQYSLCVDRLAQANAQKDASQSTVAAAHTRAVATACRETAERDYIVFKALQKKLDLTDNDMLGALSAIGLKADVLQNDLNSWVEEKHQ